MAALARNRPDIPAARIARTRDSMNAHLRDASVEGYEILIESLILPYADDRHVLAAAIHGCARVIVTMNLRDFPASALAQFSLEAVSPDAFLLALLDEDKTGVIAALRKLRLTFKNPPRSVDDLLAAMHRHGLPETAAALAAFGDAL